MQVVIDNGSIEVVSFDPAAPDARSIMLASVASIVKVTVDTEGKLSETAKVWGANVFSLAFPADGPSTVTLDTLIGDSKVAASWNTLSLSDAGKKAKSRMEVYFSNARLVAETFASLTDDDKRDIRAGTVSIHYRAGLIRKAAADVKKEASKEAKRVEAESAKSAETVTETATPSPVATLRELIETAHLALIDANADDFADASAAFAAMAADYDARVNALMDAGEVEAIAA